MTIRLLPALAALAAAPLTGFSQDASPAAAAGAAEKRKLVVHRPETKGAKYEYTGKGSQTSTADVHFDDDVSPAGNTTIEVTISGVLEVTEVSPKAGNVMSYSFTVKKMSLTDGGGDDDGLESGTVITAKVAGFKTTFFVDGGEVKDELAEGLRLALPFHYGVDERIDEESFEPKTPVAKGEKWKPDVAKMADVLKKYVTDLEVDAAKSSVEARYKGPATIDGTETDVIVSSESLVYAKIPGLPDDAKLLKATSTTDITMSLSRDGKTSAPREYRSVMDQDNRFSAKKDGKEYEMQLKQHSERHETAKPVK